MSEKNATATASISRGIGWTGWLTVIFVVLKLNPGGHFDSQVEDWPWWLVFIFPIVWAGIAFVIILVIGVIGLTAYVLERLGQRKNRRERDRRLNMTAEERKNHYYRRNKKLQR